MKGLYTSPTSQTGGAELRRYLEYVDHMDSDGPGWIHPAAGPGLGPDRGARSSWGTALLRACAELRPTKRLLRCAREGCAGGVV